VKLRDAPIALPSLVGGVVVLESHDRFDYPKPQTLDSFPLPESPPASLPEVLPAPPPGRLAGLGPALRELVETILLTLVIFFIIRFAVENYKIEGYSMQPNFQDGQFLLVNKLSYMVGHPQRGDVIVFHFPLNVTKNYIKRVIGLPGEQIQIRQGQVYVNGALIDERYPLNHADYDWGPETVAADEYFVLGDNRPESSDSHYWGSVPAKDVVGKAWITYWPPQAWGTVPDYSYAASP
jgi:signal peptidase I